MSSFKKIIGFSLAFIVLAFAIYKLLESPEKYLKRKTRELISMVSVQKTKSQMGLISKISKISKYIHFDVRLKAEYEGRIYKAKSLNEFRSLLMSYFRLNSTGKMEYKNMSVQMEDDKQGIVAFDSWFERLEKKVHCKTLLEWIKEKKWYIKKIEVSFCKELHQS